MNVKIDLDAVDARLGLKLELELRYWLDELDVAAAAECYRRHYAIAARTTKPLRGAAASLDAGRGPGDRQRHGKALDHRGPLPRESRASRSVETLVGAGAIRRRKPASTPSDRRSAATASSPLTSSMSSCWRRGDA
jgi:hypothetical protein